MNAQDAMSQITPDEKETMLNIDRRNTGLERHFSTLITTLILVSVLWVGNSLITQEKVQIRMAGTIEIMNTQIIHLKDLIKIATKGNYSTRDAGVDKREWNFKYDALHSRITAVEQYQQMYTTNKRSENVNDK